MDLASDMTTLIGPINGTLLSGASVIPGVTGTAFYTGAGGGYLDLGVFPGGGCLHYPDDCPDGISIALWLKIYELPAPNTLATIMHTGGYWYNSVGYWFYLGHDVIGFTARHELPASAAEFAVLPLHEWFHITVSYKDTHTAIFVNGCPSEMIGGSQWERGAAFTQITRFTFGCLDGGLRPTHVAIDEVVIWYIALSPEDIWRFYVNEVAK